MFWELGELQNNAICDEKSKYLYVLLLIMRSRKLKDLECRVMLATNYFVGISSKTVPNMINFEIRLEIK